MILIANLINERDEARLNCRILCFSVSENHVEIASRKCVNHKITDDWIPRLVRPLSIIPVQQNIATGLISESRNAKLPRIIAKRRGTVSFCSKSYLSSDLFNFRSRESDIEGSTGPVVLNLPFTIYNQVTCHLVPDFYLFVATHATIRDFKI